MTDPEKTRWVRYAADCAERVLGLTGQYRPQAEAAIRAARAWADNPTEELQETCRVAANAVPLVEGTPAAAASASAAYAAASALFGGRASLAAAVAVDAASMAFVNPHHVERAWQAERRRHYGLEGR